jgi:hypothetical protein
VTFTYMFARYIDSVSPLPLFSLLLSKNNFNRFSYFIFIYIYKVIDHIHPLYIYSSPPWYPLPDRNNLTFLSIIFYIFKCILIVQGGFTVVFHTCIYYTLIRLTPSIIYLFPCSHII